MLKRKILLYRLKISKQIVVFILAALTILIAGCQSTKVSYPGNAEKGVLLGIFHEGSQADLSPVRGYEQKLGKNFASLMWYLDWSTPFPMEDAKRVSDAGLMPHITWEPWFFTDREKIHLDNIIDGQWDDYINQWAEDAALFGEPMILRWGHEFNGNWYPWSVAQNGEDPQVYIDAYRKVHDAFRSAGANNVIWVWCANADSVPNKAWNVAMEAYPGDEYVDWVGIDGYNFSGNSSFKAIFTRSYNQFVTKLTKPLMIAEFATGGKGNKKGDWIKKMAADLEQYFPAIRAINWFDINKEMDWRLIVDAKTEASSKEAFSSEYFQSEASLFVLVTKEYASTTGKNITAVEESSNLTERQKAIAEPVSEDFALGASWPEESGQVLVSSDGKSDMKAEIRFAWTGEALFFRAEVIDDVACNNNKSGVNIWNGDNIEICLGLDVTADPTRSFFGKSDFQIGFSTGSIKEEIEPEIWAWGSIAGVPEGSQSLLSKTEQGYVLEGMIPWASLDASFSPEKGMELGFDLAVDDADEGADRENQTIWNGDSSFYSNPSQWGILILK